MASRVVTVAFQGVEARRVDVEVQLTGELSYGVSWFFENAVEDVAQLPSAQGRSIWGDIAGTIGYELLTALGPRYTRRYQEHPA